MSKARTLLPPSEAHPIDSLVAYQDGGISSRVIARRSGGSVTLFCFDAGQELSEHSAPFDALVQVVEGTLELTIGGEPVVVGAGEVALMPADIPHALVAPIRTRMMLVMLREPGKAA